MRLVVDDHRRVEERDLGLGAVAIGDHAPPFGGVDLLGVGAALPEIDAAACALAVKVILAHEAGQVLVLRRRALEQLGRGGKRDIGGKLEANDRSDHWAGSLLYRTKRSTGAGP